MSALPPSGAAGIALRELTDEQPIVIHGPLHGGISSSQPAEEAHTGVRLHSATESSQEVLKDDVVAATPAASALRRGGTKVAEDTAEPCRILGLDALRGFFIVAMTLGFSLHGTYYPDWMYHRQFPPPRFNLVDLPGLTWQDPPYAAFLFAMAAALPIALTRRIEQSETEISTILAILRRFLLLFTFALLVAHSNTYFTGHTQPNRVLAIIGFVLMFAVFVHRRADWNEKGFRLFNRVAWIAAIVFLLFAPAVYDSSFSPARRDDVLAGVAFGVLSGSLIWYFTRHNLAVRLAVLAAVVALHIGARGDGWIRDWWWSSPVPWLMQPSSLTLLTVVIPGTIAGDLLLDWMRSPDADVPRPSSWGGFRLSALVVLCVATVVVTVIGLDKRWVLATTQLVLASSAAGLALTFKAQAKAEQLVRRLFQWAALWLILGVFLDPAEGGIKKVPETLSYFFTVAGVALMLLVSVIVLLDMLKKSAWARPLIDVGRNPMLAYVVYTVFLNPLLELIPQLRPVLRASAGESMLRSLLSMAAMILIVQAFTRRKIVWRT